MHDLNTMNRAWMMTCTLVFGMLSLGAVIVGLVFYHYPIIGISLASIATGRHVFNRLRS